MQDRQKVQLFEEAPVPKAVMTMSVPMIISSLVMVVYNLADTYFVGMVNDPVQNAAVALAAPVLLAFNAVNNLFGVGSSSMMSRALGSKEYDISAAASGASGIRHPYGSRYRRIFKMDSYLRRGACHTECGVCLSGTGGRIVSARQHRDHERLSFKYCSGSFFYPALGIKYGGSRGRSCDLSFQLRGVSVLFCPFICQAGENFCMYQTVYVQPEQKNRWQYLRRGRSSVDPKSSECYRNDCPQ